MENKRTSQEWQELYHQVRVIDPDGWDRKNFQYSWYEEKITLKEYIDRREKSTTIKHNLYERG